MALPMPPRPTIPTRVSENSRRGTVPSVNTSFAHRRSRCAAAAQWKPRTQKAIAASAQSATVSAQTPRELVTTAPQPSNSGVRLAPTPAAAVCAHRSVSAAAATTAPGTPHPKYTSVPWAHRTASCDATAPSLSLTAAASTFTTSHPRPNARRISATAVAVTRHAGRDDERSITARLTLPRRSCRRPTHGEDQAWPGRAAGQVHS